MTMMVLDLLFVSFTLLSPVSGGKVLLIVTEGLTEELLNNVPTPGKYQPLIGWYKTVLTFD